MNFYRVDNLPIFDGRCALFGGYFYVEMMLVNDLDRPMQIRSCTIPKNDFHMTENWDCCTAVSEITRFGDGFVADILPVIISPGEVRRIIFQWKVPEDWIPLFGRPGDEEVFRLQFYDGEHRRYLWGRFEYVAGEKWMQERIGQVRRKACKTEQKRQRYSVEKIRSLWREAWQ